jgi:hypothetical protein
MFDKLRFSYQAEFFAWDDKSPEGKSVLEELV